MLGKASFGCPLPAGIRQHNNLSQGPAQTFDSSFFCDRKRFSTEPEFDQIL